MTALDPLPPGITRAVRPDGGRTDLGAFASAIHHAARVAGGTVERVVLDRPCTSYAHAALALPDGPAAVLVHRAFPLVAVSDDPDGVYLTRQYVDVPPLAAALAESGFEPVPLALLTSDPSALGLDALGDEERRAVRYWIRYAGLTQAGDVLFNDWD